MGSILARKRKDGTTAYTVNIRVKKAGKIVFRESETFEREQAAKAWMRKRETELAEPGALTKPTDPLLSDVIDKYNLDKRKAHGRTKEQVLRTIRDSKLGELRCSEVTSPKVVEYLQSLDSQASTRGNYLSHLAAVFSVAKPAWGYPLDKQVMEDVRAVANRLGVIGKSKQRSRRPTLGELDRLLTHYSLYERKNAEPMPMCALIAFSIFSTRRQEETCRLAIEDLNADHAEIKVRDMKNPGEKIGNDVVTVLPPEALELIQRRDVKKGTIWPYNAKSVSASFTRTCKFLGIENLHFHDLRHDGISRLFEMGWSIPRVATVSGHRSWQSLQRYTHVKQTGDKYEDWKWKKRLLGDATQASLPEKTDAPERALLS